MVRKFFCPKRGTRTSKTVPIVDPRKFRIFSEQPFFLAFLSSLEFLFLLLQDKRKEGEEYDDLRF